jgi:hypothetical protein
MIMTSDELARDLRDIDELIMTLSAPESHDTADADNLHWLVQRRRTVSHLLAIRRAQRGKKIVSLALWRYGSTTEVERIAGIA